MVILGFCSILVAEYSRNVLHSPEQVLPLTGTGRTSVDIGGDANLELVDKFCYLGDMLSVDGDADAAVETRIRIGWNKFRQLVPLPHIHPSNSNSGLHSCIIITVYTQHVT